MHPTRLRKEGRPADELTGRNVLLMPPRNQEVDSSMLLKVAFDERLIGADEFTAKEPAP